MPTTLNLYRKWMKLEAEVKTFNLCLKRN